MILKIVKGLRAGGALILFLLFVNLQGIVYKVEQFIAAGFLFR